MDLAALFINIGIFVVTAIAATVAWVQTNLAMQAKRDAQASQKEAALDAARAVKAAEASAVAGERAAVALERQVAIAEAVASPPDPWLVEEVSRHRFKVTNRTGHIAGDVSIDAADPEVSITLEQDDFLDVAKNQSLYFRFGGGMTDPPSAVIWIWWMAANGQDRQQFIITVE